MIFLDDCWVPLIASWNKTTFIGMSLPCFKFFVFCFIFKKPINTQISSRPWMFWFLFNISDTKHIPFNVLQKIPLSVKCFAKKERRKINMCHVGFPGLHSQILNKSAGEDLEMQEALNLTSSRGLFAVCIKTTKSQHWLHCRCNKHAQRTDHNIFHLKFSNSHPTLNWFVSLWACCHIACSLWTMFSELKEVAAADATTGTGESSKEFVDCCSALHQRREYQLAKRHHQSGGWYSTK